MVILYGGVSTIYEGMKCFESERYGKQFLSISAYLVSESMRVLLANAICQLSCSRTATQTILADIT